MLRPFADFLSGISRGAVCDEMTSKLAKLTAAVTETGRKGTLTLRIEVAPFKGSDDTVEVTASADLRAPSHNHAAVFFFDDSFQLTHDDPAMEPMISRAELAGLDGGNR